MKKAMMTAMAALVLSGCSTFAPFDTAGIVFDLPPQKCVMSDSGPWSLQDMTHQEAKDERNSLLSNIGGVDIDHVSSNALLDIMFCKKLDVNSSDDVLARLYRGQALIAAVAHYGAVYAPLTPEHAEEDAEAILSATESASKQLKDTYDALKNGGAIDLNWENIDRVGNVRSALRVATAAGKAKLRYQSGVLQRVATIFTGGVFNPKDVARSAKEALIRGVVTKAYMRAYRKDVHKQLTTFDPDNDANLAVISRILKPVCDKLAYMANRDNATHSCDLG